MERRELERQIVEKEWLMFQQVQGVNGRAACQDDWTTFLIMRLSQFEGWDTDVLESYFEDIVQAEAQERNLIMEKYAYMMEETDPKTWKTGRRNWGRWNGQCKKLFKV